VSMELAGMAAYQDRKQQLLSSLSGTVLEIGAGRGRNFAMLSRHVHWVGLEPARNRHARLAAVAARYGHRDPEILAAPAEAIPLADASVPSSSSSTSHPRLAPSPGGYRSSLRR
jgi:hypothetical protein